MEGAEHMKRGLVRSCSRKAETVISKPPCSRLVLQLQSGSSLDLNPRFLDKGVPLMSSVPVARDETSKLRQQYDTAVASLVAQKSDVSRDGQVSLP